MCCAATVHFKCLSNSFVEGYLYVRCKDGENDTSANRSSISADALIELLRICLDLTSLQFRDERYELTDGLTMGSPVSPAVANIL